MANSILTPTAVTREALRILHQKLNFVGNINRQYDDKYAVAGAKIGDTLTIRLPDDKHARLRQLASHREISVNKLMERAISAVEVLNFVAKAGKEGRRMFNILLPSLLSIDAYLAFSSTFLNNSFIDASDPINPDDS